jgi:hypothetical protein
MLARLKTITRSLKAPTAQDREAAYLDEACDRLELEYRQRQIDRGLFRARGSYPL